MYIYIYIQVARVPRIIHFMFRITIAEEKQGMRKDEGGRRKKKAGRNPGKMRKRKENVGMERKGRKNLEKEKHVSKSTGFSNSKSIGFLTLCKKNIPKVLCF